MNTKAAHLPPLDRSDPEAAIASAADAYRNWGRWGDDDVLGTLNFIDESKRLEASRLVRRGVTFSLSQSFDGDGPQSGWRGRVNPVHLMTDTGLAAQAGIQGFPHGIGGSDDAVFMPLQASTQWDGLGHIFDRKKAWNGRDAGSVVTNDGDQFTGIQTAASQFVSRGVLLDVARIFGTNDQLPDGFPITPEHIDETIRAQGASSGVGRGDILVVRTGRLTRARAEGWQEYAGGPAAGMSFTSLGWLHD
ncbi:MAG: cyclase family protein, partial [Microbacteriaceae bacterium]